LRRRALNKDKEVKEIFELPVNIDLYLLIDLLKKCLVFNPEHRISIKSLLRHPYFKDFHDKRLEEVC